MTKIIESGIVPSVLSRDDAGGASNGAPSSGSTITGKERYLLISKGENKQNRTIRKRHRPKCTNNRKEVSITSMVAHNGIEYQINNAPTYGVYLKILHKTLDQLEVCINKWKRVFMIRFDLHQKQYTPDNKMLSRFRKNLSRRIERHYGLFEVGFSWVREQEKAKQQHYHMALFLDGDKINHSATIGQIIRECWEAVRAGNTVHIPKKCYYNIIDECSKRDAVYRLSYLSKQRGKGYRPPQTKDYSTSRLTVPPQYNFKTGSKIA